MPQYYPVFLELRGRRCLLIGGDREIQRKAELLLECGAEVTVVSPQLTPRLAELVRDGSIDWEERSYQYGDLKGAFLAIASSDDHRVNRQVGHEAKVERVLLNVVDKPALCTFIAPAIVRRGEVVIAISTGGASPALARRLRESLEASEATRWADLAPVLSRARSELRRRRVQVHPDRWQECLDDVLLRMVQEGQEEAALKRLVSMLVEGVEEQGVVR